MVYLVICLGLLCLGGTLVWAETKRGSESAVRQIVYRDTIK